MSTPTKRLAALETHLAGSRCDTWVNCAMVTVFAPVMETTAEEFRRVTEVTYLGYVHGTQAAQLGVPRVSMFRRMLPLPIRFLMESTIDCRVVKVIRSSVRSTSGPEAMPST